MTTESFREKYREKYPKIYVEDDVRVKTIKNSKTKGYDPKWSKEVYKVTFINDNDYMVNDGQRNTYVRQELLNVAKWKMILIKPNLKWQVSLPTCLVQGTH